MIKDKERGKRLVPFIALFAVIGLGIGQLTKTGEISSEVFWVLGGIAIGFPVKSLYDKLKDR